MNTIRYLDSGAGLFLGIIVTQLKGWVTAVIVSLIIMSIWVAVDYAKSELNETEKKDV